MKTARPPSKRRSKPAEERRLDLMKAARELFISKGFTATTVEDITYGARIAKGTFYLHFKSKEEVLIALREQFVGLLQEELDKAMSKCAPDDWRGRLRAWLATSVHGYLDNVKLHDVVFHEIRQPGRGMTPDDESLAPMLAKGRTAGAWRVEHPLLTSVMIFHAMHGVVDHMLGRGGPIDRTSLIKTLEKAVLRMLVADH